MLNYSSVNLPAEGLAKMIHRLFFSPDLVRKIKSPPGSRLSTDEECLDEVKPSWCLFIIIQTPSAASFGTSETHKVCRFADLLMDLAAPFSDGHREPPSCDTVRWDRCFTEWENNQKQHFLFSLWPSKVSTQRPVWTWFCWCAREITCFWWHKYQQSTAVLKLVTWSQMFGEQLERFWQSHAELQSSLVLLCFFFTIHCETRQPHVWLQPQSVHFCKWDLFCIYIFEKKYIKCNENLKAFGSQLPSLQNN